MLGDFDEVREESRGGSDEFVKGLRPEFKVREEFGGLGVM